MKNIHEEIHELSQVGMIRIEEFCIKNSCSYKDIKIATHPDLNTREGHQDWEDLTMEEKSNFTTIRLLTDKEKKKRDWEDEKWEKKMELEGIYDNWCEENSPFRHNKEGTTDER